MNKTSQFPDIYRGNTYIILLERILYQDNSGVIEQSSVDNSGHTFTGQIKRRGDDTNILGTFSSTVTAENHIRFELTSEQTLNLPIARNLCIGFALTAATGERFELSKGRVNVVDPLVK